MMIRNLICRSAVLAGVVSLVCAATASATVRITAPTIDFKGDVVAVQVPNTNGFATSETWTVYWGSPYNPYGTPPLSGLPFTRAPGNYNPAYSTPFGYLTSTFKDYITLGNLPNLNNNPARFVATAAYIKYDDSDTGNQTLYTVYGHDTDPTTPGSLALSGFDPAGTVPAFSGEQIYGLDGVTYAGSGQYAPISSLATIIGGADFSEFSGNPNWQVYVSTTSIPFAATVPEPASLSLLAIGGSTLLTRRRRIKSN